MIRLVRLALFVALCLFGVGVSGFEGARAESMFERLVMPGDLAQAHAKLQDNCQNCHASFDQGAQSSLCIDCHKPIAADLTAASGFHGRSPEVRALECSNCHKDHQGRDFALVQLDRETFDHSMTDFKLLGAHAKAECSSCHLPGKKMSAAPSDCVSCHKLDEPHRGALGPDCGRCHGADRWSEVKFFDHSKTKFALTGGHEKLTCSACHAGEVWKGLPLDCVGCHKIDDVHKSGFGPACADCHETAKWTLIHFNHDRDTKFALKGKHAKVACTACHAVGTEAKQAPSACIDCHKADDVHKGALGPDCAACHSSEAWTKDVVFDHGLTRMPLLGLHAVVPCAGCHASKDFAATDLACVSCHQKDDIHKGALGDACSDCHNPNGWAFWRFDHDSQTKFSLTGAHKGLKCDSCHAAGTTPAKVSTVCATCHQKQDVHKGTFGANCELCHSTTTFKGARLQVAPKP